MITLMVNNLVNPDTKEKYEKESKNIPSAEIVIFHKDKTVTEMSKEYPVTLLTFTIRKDNNNNNLDELITSNSYMTLGNYVQKVIEKFLNNSPFNYDKNISNSPIDVLTNYTQTKDARLLSIKVPTKKPNIDQMICRVILLYPIPIDKDKLLISELENDLNKIIETGTLDEAASNINQKKEYVSKKEKNNIIINETLPDETLDIPLDSTNASSDIKTENNNISKNIVKDSDVNDEKDAAKEGNESEDNKEESFLDFLNNNSDSSDDNTKIDYDDYDEYGNSSSVIVNTSENKDNSKFEQKPDETPGFETELEIKYKNLQNELKQLKEKYNIEETQASLKNNSSADANTENTSENNEQKEEATFDSFLEEIKEPSSDVENNNKEDEENDIPEYESETISTSLDYVLNESENADSDKSEIVKDINDIENSENNKSENNNNTEANENTETNITENTSSFETDEDIEYKVFEDTYGGGSSKPTENVYIPKMFDIDEDKIIEKAIKTIRKKGETFIDEEKRTYSDDDEDTYNEGYSEELIKFIDEQKKTYGSLTSKKLNEIQEENKELFMTIPDDFDDEKSSMSRVEIDRIFAESMNTLIDIENIELGKIWADMSLKDKFFENTVKPYLKRVHHVFDEDIPLLTAMLDRALFGYYVLTPLIANDEISDIKILNHETINIKVHGKHYTVSNLKFLSNNDLLQFVAGMLQRNKVQIRSNIIVFTDVNFNEKFRLRFNISLPIINSNNSFYVHIRKVPKKKTDIFTLIEKGMLDKNVALYLMNKAKNSSIIFSGPSASGKTTLMNALIDETDFSKTILTIQESDELFTRKHPSAMFQHITQTEDLDKLGQNGLLVDAGYFIIGEIKGKEARSFIRAANTGHLCWCSVHSPSAKDSLLRLADYIKYGSDYSIDDCLKMLKDMQVLIYIENFKVKQIDEVVGYDAEKKDLIYKNIYRYVEK